jgi:hypothetical protein
VDGKVDGSMGAGGALSAGGATSVGGTTSAGGTTGAGGATGADGAAQIDGSKVDVALDAGSLDAAIDGAGTSDVGEGDTALAGQVVVLVPFSKIAELGPPTIAIDDAYVYWVGSDTAGYTLVQRVPKAGGDVTVAYQPPVRPSQGGPGALVPTLAVDATSLYVVIGDDIYHSEILKVAKDGSTHTEPSLLQVQGLGTVASTIAIDSQNVYFDALSGGIDRVPITVADGTTLAPGPNDPIGGMPIGFPNINHNTLVSDGTNVYYAANHWMLKAPVGGGAPVVLVPFTTDTANIDYVDGSSHPAIGGGYVYWINYGDVFKVSVNGGAPGTKPETLVTGASHGDRGYAITDGQSVYYLDGGTLWKLPVTGGTPSS